ILADGIPRACLGGRCVPVECTAMTFPCPPPLSCSNNICVDNPACVLDPFEPNNDLNEFQFLEPNTTVDDLTLCAERDTDDFFAVPLLDGEDLVVTVDFDGDAADVDLEVYNPESGEVVVRSSGIGSQEQVVVPGNEGLVGAFVRIFLTFGETVTYSLSLESIPSVECSRNGDCRPGEICEEGQCVEEIGECVRDDGCAADQICEANTCVAPSGCAVETDCGSDAFECVAGNCVPRPTCRNNSDCDFGIPGVVCGGDGFCEAIIGFCNQDNDCPGSQSCVFGICFDVGNPECIRDNQCAPNEVCEGGLCR
ncbi:MAG: hypothetical protein AAFS10_26945, partial [Myxococcota bacterium]